MLSNLLFGVVLVGAAAVLTVGVVFGVRNWREPGGKAIAIASGVLLLAVCAFSALVSVIVVSGWDGHPF